MALRAGARVATDAALHDRPGDRASSCCCRCSWRRAAHFLALRSTAQRRPGRPSSQHLIEGVHPGRHLRGLPAPREPLRGDRPRVPVPRCGAHDHPRAGARADPLTVENVRKYPTAHPRCGTEFLVIFILVSILLFSLLAGQRPVGRHPVGRILLIPVIAAVSYEVLRWGAKRREHSVGALAVPARHLAPGDHDQAARRLHDRGRHRLHAGGARRQRRRPRPRAAGIRRASPSRTPPSWPAAVEARMRRGRSATAEGGRGDRHEPGGPPRRDRAAPRPRSRPSGRGRRSPPIPSAAGTLAASRRSWPPSSTATGGCAACVSSWPPRAVTAMPRAIRRCGSWRARSSRSWRPRRSTSWRSCGSSCCPGTPTTSATSSSRSAAAPAARRRPSSPRSCSACTCATRSGTAGGRRRSRPARPGIGGLREVILEISGQGAYSRLKYEGGVHRVQRVPETESSGRIHTSTATVAVLPKADEVDVHIDEDRDLRIDVKRSSGPGGQSVNTTDSAVRITHLPTGLVVEIQDEKSQHKNKAKALAVLRSRLLEMEQRKAQAEEDAVRRSMVGSARALREDPHLQLPPGPHHRPSHRARRPRPAQRPRRRPRPPHRCPHHHGPGRAAGIDGAPARRT